MAAGLDVSGEIREGVVDDRPQHLLIRVGLADHHQALAGRDQALRPGYWICRCRDLAEPDGVELAMQVEVIRRPVGIPASRAASLLPLAAAAGI